MKINFEKYAAGESIVGGTLQTLDMVMYPYPDARVRTIRVWLPESYDGVKRFPVIYMHDGQNLFRGLNDRPKWDVDRAVSALAADGITCIIVAIDSAMQSRSAELQPPYRHETEHLLGSRTSGRGMLMPDGSGDVYADFIIKYLKPLIDENLMTLSDAAHTCIGGASMGGLQSYYMAMRNPEIFGRALCFSPAFPVFPLADILARIDAYDMAKIADSRFYFYNGGQTLDREIIEPTLAVYHKLEERGLDSLHSIFVYDSREPHYETAWAKYFPDAVRYLFADDNSVPMPRVMRRDK